VANENALLHASRRSRDYVGQTIAGKYAVIRLLGEGGMGAVYEVRHVVIGRRFAVKFLHWEIAHGNSTVARFKREAEAAGRLENDHVVAVVDVGATDEGTPYLVMEYLQGENLGALLARSGSLPVARAVRLVLQVCRGLRAAHAQGMIHRDLKPENLFVVQGSDRAEQVKILDFGIVKWTESPGGITHSGQTLGTPYYMSPEQARGDSQVDERTDIYAVGVLLYELLTAEKPHPGSNATAVLFHLLKQEAIRIERLRPGLPAGLGDVVHRAFAFDAAERFSDVSSLSAALRPFEATEDGEDALPSASAPVSGGSLGTLSTTELQISRGVGGTNSRQAVAAIAREIPERVSRRRSLGRVATLALVLLAASLVFFGRVHVASTPQGAAASSASPAVLGSIAPRALPDDEPSVSPQVSAEAAARTLERPIGHSKAEAAPSPGDTTLSGSVLPQQNTKSPRRLPPSPPATASSARQLLREQLYEP
jgi:serine/threonine protein kinase